MDAQTALQIKIGQMMFGLAEAESAMAAKDKTIEALKSRINELETLTDMKAAADEVQKTQ